VGSLDTLDAAEIPHLMQKTIEILQDVLCRSHPPVPLGSISSPDAERRQDGAAPNVALGVRAVLLSPLLCFSRFSLSMFSPFSFLSLLFLVLVSSG
jgi:hypothetical protein